MHMLVRTVYEGYMGGILVCIVQGTLWFEGHDMQRPTPREFLLLGSGRGGEKLAKKYEKLAKYRRFLFQS